MSSLVFATVYINCRVVRLGNGEVQSVEFSYITIIIENSVRVDTGSIVCHTCLRPNVRIFLIRMRIIRSINLTYSHLLALFFNHAKDTDAVALASCLRRVFIFTSGNDVVFVPVQCFACTQDNGLHMLFLR